MAENIDRDKLEIIIGYLQQNSSALSMLDRRMDSLGADVRVVRESVQSITARQAELERDSANRMAHCSEVMDAMKRRISALENEMTPMPIVFDPKSLDDSTKDGSYVVQGGNGSSGEMVLRATEEDLVETVECYHNHEIVEKK